MPPKKRDKELEAQKLPRMDQIQADHELFLQAFEMMFFEESKKRAYFKRRQKGFYRFFEDISGSIGRSDLEMMLNERTNTNLPISTDEKSNIDALVYLFHLYISAKNEKIQATPIFLYRNLSYMKQRMSRSHKSRRGFRIDTILQRLIEKNSLNQNPGIRGFMTLTFLGFYDKKIEASQDPVKVETLLLKICHKKRKDVSSPIMQVSVGISDVPINPSENQPPPKAPTISIPNESFSFNNGHVAKTYMLLLRVYCMSNSSCLITSCDLDSEPAQKKRKSSPGNMKNGEEVKLYGSELIVYDKHNRCLLTDGDYELGLQEVLTNVRSSPKKHSSWETLSDIKESGPFEVFSRGPTLKFRLSWTMEASNGLVDRPTLIHPLPNGDNKENRPGNIDLDRCSNNLNNNNASPPNSSPLTPSKMSGTLEKIDTSSVTQQIVYQFLYNNNSRQQTEACEDLHCPWCSLDCGRLYSLLKHLKLCHSRFTFTYVPISQGARIDVAINECYDGSYAGSPHELISQPSGIAFSRTGPTRRTSVTNILVCRPKRTKPSLSEFLELDENEFESQRPYITGHNRLYHHTVTCLPIYPKEMDADSEGENDPRWLQTKTMMMIDDFTDVNEGEKELMKMWNLHVMKYGYVGDCQIPIACQMFLETKGKELLMKNLYRNFVLHMSSLFDFGLISPVVLFQTIQKLQEIMKEGGEDSDVRKVLQKSHEAQVERWLTTGVHDELNKATTTTAKTNFNNEISNHNARRKTTLGPLNSPPSQSIKSILNNASKHATMIGQASNKSITNMNGKTTNSFASINKTNGSITSNNITKAQEINGSNVTCKSEINTIISSDLPPRRKSTNSTGQSIDNPLPIRRKSMASENTSNEYHRRKLILDSIPSGGNVNPKTSQNNDSY